MSITPIQIHTIEQHAVALSRFFPGGPLFGSTNSTGTVLGDLITGLAFEMQRAEEYVKSLQDELIPDMTSNLIPDWERVVGIPDGCFDGTGSNDKRRSDILVKLASLGIQTSQDFEDLATLFGFTITVLSGTDWAGGGPFPFGPIDNEQDARFTIVVLFTNTGPVFPLTFPISFGSDIQGFLECLFNKLKPANCQITFQEV